LSINKFSATIIEYSEEIPVEAPNAIELSGKIIIIISEDKIDGNININKNTIDPQVSSIDEIIISAIILKNK